MALRQSAASTQYVQVQVLAVSGGEAYDPTGDSVSMAFIPSASPLSPASGQWNTGSWQTDPDGSHWAQALVGPANGGLTLGTGSYVVWIRVTDDPEVPALPGPVLTVTL